MKNCCIIAENNPKWQKFENSIDGDDFTDKLQAIVEQQSKTNNIKTFTTSLNLGIETLAAELVLKAREQTSGISLECQIPYENQAEFWCESDRIRYFNITAASDKAYFFSIRYYEGCIEDCYNDMIEKSDIIIITEYMAKKLTLSDTSKTYIYI